MILLFILSQKRLYAMIFEQIFLIFMVYILFQAINKFGKGKDCHLLTKFLFRKSFPIITALTIPIFIVRFILEFIGIRSSLLFFLGLHLTIVLVIHLKIYQKGLIETRGEEHFDYYAQYHKNYIISIWGFLIIGFAYQSIRLVESLTDQTLLLPSIMENYEFTAIVMTVCYAITKLINLTIQENKRLAPIIFNKSILFSMGLSCGPWLLFITIYGLIVRAAPFQVFGFGILVLLYIITFLVISRIVSKSEQKKFEQKMLEEFQAKCNSCNCDNQKKEEVILSVRDLVTYFYTDEGIVRAVEGVSFNIYNNDILGLVGESGCGKSVTALSILRLVRPPGKTVSGQVLFHDEDLLKKSEDEILKYLGDRITMIFQDPLNSLNPVFKIGDQLTEVYHLHKSDELIAAMKTCEEKLADLKEEFAKINLQLEKLEFKDDDALLTKKQELEKDIEMHQKFTSPYSIARENVIELLKDVGIPDPEMVYDRYPHELSGGMRQRVMIAMALACCPELLIADEPTTALDVTIQAQILDLIVDLQKKYNTSILFITHDLGIISQICQRVAVMYCGYIVEYGNAKDIFQNPSHPYTQGLLEAIPRIGIEKDKLPEIPGSVPNLLHPPTGCRFHPRCKHRFEPCDKVTPKMIEVGKNKFVACHLYDPAYVPQEV